MARVTFDEDHCKGCALCVGACPKSILNISDRLNDKGYRVAEISDADKCIACAFCARICPDCIITVEK